MPYVSYVLWFFGLENYYTISAINHYYNIPFDILWKAPGYDEDDIYGKPKVIGNAPAHVKPSTQATSFNPKKEFIPKKLYQEVPIQQE